MTRSGAGFTDRSTERAAKLAERNTSSQPWKLKRLCFSYRTAPHDENRWCDWGEHWVDQNSFQVVTEKMRGSPFLVCMECIADIIDSRMEFIHEEEENP